MTRIWMMIAMTTMMMIRIRMMWMRTMMMMTISRLKMRMVMLRISLAFVVFTRAVLVFALFHSCTFGGLEI